MKKIHLACLLTHHNKILREFGITFHDEIEYLYYKHKYLKSYRTEVFILEIVNYLNMDLFFRLEIYPFTIMLTTINGITNKRFMDIIWKASFDNLKNYLKTFNNPINSNKNNNDL